MYNHESSRKKERGDILTLNQPSSHHRALQKKSDSSRAQLFTNCTCPSSIFAYLYIQEPNLKYCAGNSTAFVGACLVISLLAARNSGRDLRGTARGVVGMVSGTPGKLV